MPLTVVLPMPRAMYEEDFHDAESRDQFAALCAAAVDLFELPLAPGSTEAAIAEPGPGRSRQYAAAGVFLCAHCHVLLALWDGKESDQLGGTSQVVRFHHHDVMPGYTPRATASRLNLTDDESDLVYHVVCSRDRPDGEPAAGLEPLRHVLVHDRRSTAARARRCRRGIGKVFRLHERVQPRSAVVRGIDRQGTLLAADAASRPRCCRRASGTSTRRSAPPTGSRSTTRSA